MDATGATATLTAGKTLTTQVLNIALAASSVYQARVYAGTAGSGTFTMSMKVVQ